MSGVGLGRGGGKKGGKCGVKCRHVKGGGRRWGVAQVRLLGFLGFGFFRFWVLLVLGFCLDWRRYFAKLV